MEKISLKIAALYWLKLGLTSFGGPTGQISMMYEELVEKRKWIPAINRFKVVVKDYETTIYVEEALHRLVELHYKLGLQQEAEKYAVLLGYNYRSSKWYEASYKILNKKNFENYKKSGKIYVNNVEKIVETLLSIIDLLKLVLTNNNDDNIDHDHYLINEEIKLDERI